MIKYEWRTSLSSDESAELADLLQRAADYDAEPEYSTIDFSDIEHAMTQVNSTVRHLLIWMLPYATAMGESDQPQRIAGVLRIAIDGDGTAQAGIVIDPRLRSIGITTLLLERVGLDTSAPQGWTETGAHTVTAWARGDHPAAGRISNRFLIPRTRRVWKLIRSTDSAEHPSAATVLEPIEASGLRHMAWAAGVIDSAHALREAGCIVGVVVLDLQPVASDEFGRCATVQWMGTPPGTDVRMRRRLLDGAAAVAYHAGFSGVISYVDSDDTDMVNACRLAGFQHDRTDVLFQLGGQR